MTQALAFDPWGDPVAKCAYTISAVLESPEPEDVPRFQQLHRALVQEGIEFRRVWSSFFNAAQPFSDDVFGYIERHCLPIAVAESGENLLPLKIAQYVHGDFWVFCMDLDDPRTAPEFGYRYWAEIPTVEPGQPLKPLPHVQLIFPLSFPVERLDSLAVTLFQTLRVRWGVAGFGYSTLGFDDATAERQAVYAHARRFHGFDVGFHVREMERLYDGIRTAGWLTFVGRSLLDRLTTPPPEIGEDLADGRLLRAGSVPLRLDVNRLEDSPELQRIANWLLPVTVQAMDPGAPWSEQDVSDWLSRLRTQKQ